MVQIERPLWSIVLAHFLFFWCFGFCFVLFVLFDFGDLVLLFRAADEDLFTSTWCLLGTFKDFLRKWLGELRNKS